MKISRIFLLLLFIQWGFNSTAQSKQDEAKQNLQDLKQSFLLVRLQTKDITISGLESRGMEKEAEEVRKNQYEENRETILSFEQTFNFCPVYFFYASDSEKIRNGELVGNVFNASLEPVDSVKLQKRPFFTAQFSQTENLGISGLILMDMFMIPLEPPFPYYERKYVFLSLIKISKARMAEKMNDKLYYHYNAWFGKN